MAALPGGAPGAGWGQLVPGSVQSPDFHFDPSDPRIKQEIIVLIAQYLEDAGFSASTLVLQDEAQLKAHLNHKAQTLVRRLRQAILDGTWDDVLVLCKQVFHPKKAQGRRLHDGTVFYGFLHAVHRQNFLELIDRHEYQQAYTYLAKRIKPLENIASGEEMKDLCYLLTCKSVQDVPRFRGWDPVTGRQELVAQLEALLEYTLSDYDEQQVPKQRLLQLMRQAVAYQVQFDRYQSKVAPCIETLLTDFQSFTIPNATQRVLTGHRGSVKCVDFVGLEAEHIVSGSSDNHLRLWESGTGQCVREYAGHTGRIWDVSASPCGQHFCSGSADGSAKLWSVAGEAKEAKMTFTGHRRDVYSVCTHPAGNHVATGGYDGTAHLFDVRTGVSIRQFEGHELSVSKVLFNGHGNLLLSGSKDCTIKLWDITSGVCVKTFSESLAEVTSVDLSQTGNQLLVAMRGNTNSLLDMRMARVFKQLHGHQNTSKHFIRAGFGPSPELVTGGSEDGKLYMWDIESGEVIQTLEGHAGTVYGGAWNHHSNLMASCSDDKTLRTWCYQEPPQPEETAQSPAPALAPGPAPPTPPPPTSTSTSATPMPS